MNTNNEQMTLEQARPFLLGFVVTHRDQDKALCDAIEVLLAATAPRPIDEAAEREAFEQSQIAARMAEGWQNEDAIRKHYLVLRKDGHWQDLTTYQRWEGWLVAKRHAASVGVRLSPDQARSILEGVPATPDNGLRDDVIETLAAIAGMPQPSTASAAQGEPVGRVCDFSPEFPLGIHWRKSIPPIGTDLYLAPPPAAGREVPDDVIRHIDDAHAYLLELYFKHQLKLGPFATRAPALARGLTAAKAMLAAAPQPEGLKS